MNDFLQHYGAIAAAVATAAINFAWSGLNLRLMRSMESRFVTRVEFQAEERVNLIRHQDIEGRLNRAGV